ncbi:MAG: ATP-binding cassette domain-containing protein, partial [Saprospiraceae bacterium]|nr:ATP-binding cassette domain-containing protein [Saprospiraceae bacterium]
IGNGMFGLLGPNGAGKSTLMNTIVGLQKPVQETLCFNGVNIVEEPSLKKQLGYLPQDFGVYLSLSAGCWIIAVTESFSEKKIESRNRFWRC